MGGTDIIIVVLFCPKAEKHERKRSFTNLANVVPFRALRYDFTKSGDVKSVISPPYDIVSEGEQDALEARSPYNVIRLERPRGSDCYLNAGALLRGWQDDGVLCRDEAAAFYLYQEEFQLQGQRCRVGGLIGRVRLEDFSRGIVLPHEETLSKAKEDRLRLMRTTYCNFSPIYALYHDPEHTVSRLLESVWTRTPLTEVTGEDGVIHRLWRLSDPALAQGLTAAFLEKKLYIADGHHRYETGLRFREEMRSNAPSEAIRADSKYIMMLLTDMEDPGLRVLPTHRLVKNIPNFEPSMVLSCASNFFSVEKHTGPDTLEKVLAGRSNTVAYYFGGEDFFLLEQKPGVSVHSILPDRSEAYCGLDVTVLHTLLLEPALGISPEKMAAGGFLDYTRSTKEALDSVRRGDYQCAFFLNPTKVTQIRDVALAGEKMPQKSTYFYPKPITGLVMNQMGEPQRS